MRVSPSAIIFDYGNVLSGPQPIADTQAMAEILDLPPARFAEVYWRFRVAYDAAALDPVEYWNTVARTASRAVTADQMATLIGIDSGSWSHPDPVTPQWANRLRAAGLKTAILSNMPFPVRDYVLRCSWLPEFDARVFSCELGVCKPASEIYLVCLNKLGAAPSEVLFLDDREANVRAARTLGIHAILFTNPPAAAQEMSSNFEIPVTLESLMNVSGGEEGMGAYTD